jgi:hypothetical protein
MNLKFCVDAIRPVHLLLVMNGDSTMFDPCARLLNTSVHTWSHVICMHVICIAVRALRIYDLGIC